MKIKEESVHRISDSDSSDKLVIDLKPKSEKRLKKKLKKVSKKPHSSSEEETVNTSSDDSNSSSSGEERRNIKNEIEQEKSVRDRKESILEKYLNNFNYDVWTLQVPEDFNVNNLLHAKLDLGHLTDLEKLRVNSYVYDNDCKNSAGVIVQQSEKIIQRDIKGHLIVQLKQEDNTVETFSLIETKTPVFPNDLKIRHPLLGCDWESHIAKADDVLCDHKKTRKGEKRKRVSETEANGVKKKKKLSKDINNTH